MPYRHAREQLYDPLTLLAIVFYALIHDTDCPLWCGVSNFQLCTKEDESMLLRSSSLPVEETREQERYW
jgi:hypothetical protein